MIQTYESQGNTATLERPIGYSEVAPSDPHPTSELELTENARTLHDAFSHLRELQAQQEENTPPYKLLEATLAVNAHFGKTMDDTTHHMFQLLVANSAKKVTSFMLGDGAKDTANMAGVYLLVGAVDATEGMPETQADIVNDLRKTLDEIEVEKGPIVNPLFNALEGFEQPDNKRPLLELVHSVEGHAINASNAAVERRVKKGDIRFTVGSKAVTSSNAA